MQSFPFLPLHLYFFSDKFCKNIVKEGSGRGMVRKEETGKKKILDVLV